MEEESEMGGEEGAGERPRGGRIPISKRGGRRGEEMAEGKKSLTKTE